MFEILVDGKPRSYRDTKLTAMEPRSFSKAEVRIAKSEGPKERGDHCGGPRRRSGEDSSASASRLISVNALASLLRAPAYYKEGRGCISMPTAQGCCPE
jgi:hypothetical protein